VLLFFVLFIFFIFHVQFLLKNVFLGVDEAQFFAFVMRYPFSHQVAVQSLWFVLACAGVFWLGYKIAYRSVGHPIKCKEYFEFKKWRNELHLLNFMGIVMISYMGVVGGVTGFSYGPMTQLRESYGFIFELRMIYLLLLAHLLFNIPWRQFMARPELKFTRIVLAMYFVGSLSFQARSAIFELGVCILIPLLMWTGDKVKVKYVLIVFGLLIVPNIIVLGRMGVPDDPYELVDGLFSIEYTMILDKFLGAAIDTGYQAKEALSFLPQLGLIIPSPIRNLLEIQATNTDYIEDLSEAAEVYGGGFSLVAQMYTDFGWFSPLVFGLLGLLIGRVNYQASKVGRVKLLYATAPLLYSIFILTFRNDFGVFLKYTIQLFMMAVVLNFLLRIRLGVRNAN